MHTCWLERDETDWCGGSNGDGGGGSSSTDPSFPRPDPVLDFRRSLLHHFHSGCALKWASFTYVKKSHTSGNRVALISNRHLFTAGKYISFCKN